MCMAHIFDWLLLCSHPFGPTLLHTFFLIAEKSNRQCLQNWTFDSQMCPPQKVVHDFHNSVACGQHEEMQLHRPTFLCTRIMLQIENHTVEKMRTAMVTTGSPNPVQKNSLNALALSILITHHPLSLSWQDAPTLCLPRNYFFERKHPYSPKFVEFANLQNLMHWEEKQGHFLPCQLWSLTPSIIIESKRQGVYFGVKNNVSSLYFTNFHTKSSQNTHLFCVIFPDAATNQQQSTKKRGKSMP